MRHTTDAGTRKPHQAIRTLLVGSVLVVTLAALAFPADAARKSDTHHTAAPPAKAAAHHTALKPIADKPHPPPAPRGDDPFGGRQQLHRQAAWQLQADQERQGAALCLAPRRAAVRPLRPRRLRHRIEGQRGQLVGCRRRRVPARQPARGRFGAQLPRQQQHAPRPRRGGQGGGQQPARSRSTTPTGPGPARATSRATSPSSTCPTATTGPRCASRSAVPASTAASTPPTASSMTGRTTAPTRYRRPLRRRPVGPRRRRDRQGAPPRRPDRRRPGPHAALILPIGSCAGAPPRKLDLPHGSNQVAACTTATNSGALSKASANVSSPGDEVGPSRAELRRVALGDAHAAALAREGFRVTPTVAGIPTAVMGEAGEGGPVIAILGEYDALPGLSQEAGVAEPQAAGRRRHGPRLRPQPARLRLAAGRHRGQGLAGRNGLPGRVRYYGCPAEEGGAAKGFMVRAGASTTWTSPSPGIRPRSPASTTPMCLANTRSTSLSPAAPATPPRRRTSGRRALDAVELMNIGVNYMREHMPSDARIHYAYLDAGGVAPNVVQARAKVRYLIRARDLPDLYDLIARVQQDRRRRGADDRDTMSTQVVAADSNLLGNTPLEQAMYDNFLRLGPPPFDEADRAFAADDPATCSREDITRLSAASACRSTPDWRCATPRAARRPGRADDRLDRCRRRRPGWCPPCRRAAPPTPSARPAIPGSSPPRASRRWPTRAWCTSPR